MWLVQYVKKDRILGVHRILIQIWYFFYFFDKSNMILRLVSKLTGLSYQMRHDTDSKKFSYIKQIKLCVYMIVYNQMTWVYNGISFSSDAYWNS